MHTTLHGAIVGRIVMRRMFVLTSSKLPAEFIPPYAGFGHRGEHQLGIFDGWKARRRKAFVDRAEELAGSLQMEIYKHAEARLAARHGDELAGKVAAAIANYVCRCM